jgi:thiol-disulfide isomerase/thioredoxin
VRRIFVILWLTILFSGIACLFWYNEWKFSLPTPVPKQYHAVTTGTHIDLSSEFKYTANRPVFIHFFNPNCPCSRFNMPYFRSLAKQYGDKIFFAVVVLNKDKKYTSKEIQDKYDLNIPVLFDKSLADECGVYSTPQAVLLDAAHNLYYRGNYNRSRYCTDKNSNYAQMAIDTMLNNIAHPVFSAYALKSYGCELPVCTK